MDVDAFLGWFLLITGAMQTFFGWRTPGAVRKQMMLPGVGLMSFGLSRLFAHSSVPLRLGSAAVMAAFYIVIIARQRRFWPRQSIVLISLMVFSFAMIVIDALGYTDRIPASVQRFALRGVIVALGAGMIWAIVTLVRAIRAPFKPIPPGGRSF